MKHMFGTEFKSSDQLSYYALMLYGGSPNSRILV